MVSALEFLLRRDRLVMTGALLLTVVMAWAWLIAGAGMERNAVAMTRMYAVGEMVMQPVTWTVGYAAVIFAMWWIMMIAMMLPSAAPTLLLAAAINRKTQPDRAPYGTSAYFALGYLTAWAVFSLVAVAAQWGLAESDLLSPMLHATTPAVVGLLLSAAGIWQFTPWKKACLTHCRSPLQFLVQRHRKGNASGFVMGIEHGMYCLGCCWAMMGLLFAGGVMNLYWIVGLALYVAAEKLLREGQIIRRVAGGALVLWGLAIMAAVL